MFVCASVVPPCAEVGVGEIRGKVEKLSLILVEDLSLMEITFTES